MSWDSRKTFEELPDIQWAFGSINYDFIGIVISSEEDISAIQDAFPEFARYAKDIWHIMEKNNFEYRLCGGDMWHASAQQVQDAYEGMLNLLEENPYVTDDDVKKWRTYISPTNHIGKTQKKTPENRPGFVYVIRGEETNLYKIGRTKNWEQRIGDIRNSSPTPIEIIGIFHTEKDHIALELDIHEKFSEYRQHGEWFEFCDDILEELISVIIEREGVRKIQ
jgi:hypothetical protein